MLIVLLVLFIVLLVISTKQINEYERGILFRFGKFAKILKPGWHLVFPIIHSYKKVDIRTKAVDVPEQEAITRDNVSIKIKTDTPAAIMTIKQILKTFATWIMPLISNILTANTSPKKTVPISHININDEPIPAYVAHLM